ncbi:MAG: PH domain-containing protein [Jatrophihabitans sp.]
MSADLTAAPPLPVEDATWHRLSPRMLLVHPVIEVGRALPALVGLVFAGGAHHNGSYWGLVGAGVVAVLSLSRWFTTRLRITPENVQLRRGLIVRKTLTTSRERIRTVDVTSHLLHRVLGLARVVVGTGTNDRKGEGRILLDGLPTSDAHQLRDDLLHREPQSPPTGVARTVEHVTAAGAERELVRLDRRWIRYAPFTLSGVLTGLVLWGFYWRIQSESGVDLTKRGPLHAVARWFDGMPTTAGVLIVIAAVLMFVGITSTVGYVLAFWNFRLVRHDGGTLQVTRGLITTRATSIEHRRLVGVQVSEPLGLRLVGAARTLVIATGLRTGRGAERGGETLLPPAPLTDAVAVCALVLDGTSALRTELIRHPPAARRRHLTRAVIGGVVVLAALLLGWATGAPVWTVGVGIGVLLGSVALGLDRYASLGHALADGFLVARLGSLIRRRSVLHCDAVIGWNLESTFFQRRLRLTTLTATTAAGRQGYGVIDVDPGEALRLADAVTPGLLTQFCRTPQ